MEILSTDIYIAKECDNVSKYTPVIIANFLIKFDLYLDQYGIIHNCGHSTWPLINQSSIHVSSFGI